MFEEKVSPFLEIFIEEKDTQDYLDDISSILLLYRNNKNIPRNHIFDEDMEKIIELGIKKLTLDVVVKQCLYNLGKALCCK